MRINNPRLFNGDLLATQAKIADWLGVTLNKAQETISGQINTGLIPISGITVENSVFPIYADKIKMAGDSEQTISAKFESIAEQIGAVKKYAATAKSGEAISVTTASATDANNIVTDTFTVGLNLNGSSLTQTSGGLKVTDGYVEGIVSGTTAADLATGIKLVKLGDVTDSNTAASYQVQFNGVALGNTIDVPKDRFLSSVIFNNGTGSGDDSLTFNFIIADGSVDAVTVPLSGLFDEYTAGAGIDVQATATGLEISGVVDSTSDPYFSIGPTGFKLTGVSADIEYLSGQIDAITQQVQATDKFVSTGSAVVSSVANPVNDTLYYNDNGQAMIYDGNAWNNVSMEALTTIDANVNNTTTATSQAIKTYVDAEVSGVAEDVTALGNDLAELSGKVETISGNLDNVIDNVLPKKAEIYQVAKTFGGSTSATITGRVIAVYDATGEQCYPTISYNAANDESTLFAATEATSGYTVVYTTIVNNAQ